MSYLISSHCYYPLIPNFNCCLQNRFEPTEAPLVVVWGLVPSQVMTLCRMVSSDPHATNVFFACLAAVFSALVGPLFLFHANLVSSNMTTVEYVS